MKRKKPKSWVARFLAPRRGSPWGFTLVLVVGLSAVVGLRLTVFSHAASGPQLHIISTLYAYPTESPWTQVESSAPTVRYAIADICAPDGSGSGCNGSAADAKNTAWTPTINALSNDGITPLFYISTNYGATSVATIESELRDAISWYGTASPMFDTMEPSGTCDDGGSHIACTTYNADLYNYSVSEGAAAVVFNPGTTYNVSAADMFGSKEIIQVFEGTAASFRSTSFPSWMSAYPASEFSATLSTGTSANVGTDVTDAARDEIGNFYEDDEAEPPNYSTLPSYWTTEVHDVAATDVSATPTPTPVPTPVHTPTPTAKSTPVPTAKATPVPTVVAKATTTPTPTSTPVLSPSPTDSTAPIATSSPGTLNVTSGGGTTVSCGSEKCSSTAIIITLPNSVPVSIGSSQIPVIGGTVAITLPQSNSGGLTTKLYVDGTQVSTNGSLDTRYLLNGKYTVTLIAKGSGKPTQTVTREISVNNRLNPLEFARDSLFFAFHGDKSSINAGVAVLLVGLVLGLADLSWWVWRESSKRLATHARATLR